MAGLKVVAINIAIIFTLLGLVNYGGAAIWEIGKALSEKRVYEDKRASYPNYDQVDWAQTHFDEFSRLHTRYEDYTGWRREAFAGETININEDGIRATSEPLSKNPKATVWLFGGSTMWGTGVDDANTIPSLLARTHGYKTVNYGESGYVSRQGLNTLMEQLGKEPTPDIVIFYDGSNDVFHKCRAYADGFGTSREEQIRARMELEPKTLAWQIETLRQFAQKRSIGGEKTDYSHNCHKDKEKANIVAKTLVNNWTFAKRISESHGAKFIAILQPISYLSETRLDHLDLPEVVGEQYKIVYPLIRHYAKAANLPVLDYVNKFDVDNYLYIDISHVSENGNSVIADSISLELENLLGKVEDFDT